MVTPRQYDDLTQGWDENRVLETIRKLVFKKVIVCYEALNTFRLCGISNSLVHGFIDLKRSQPLGRKFGNPGGQIRLNSMVKRCNLTWKSPMRTPKICKIIQ